MKFLRHPSHGPLLAMFGCSRHRNRLGSGRNRQTEISNERSAIVRHEYVRLDFEIGLCQNSIKKWNIRLLNQRGLYVVQYECTPAPTLFQRSKNTGKPISLCFLRWTPDVPCCTFRMREQDDLACNWLRFRLPSIRTRGSESRSTPEKNPEKEAHFYDQVETKGALPSPSSGRRIVNFMRDVFKAWNITFADETSSNRK